MTLTTTPYPFNLGLNVSPKTRSQISAIGATANGYLNTPGFAGEVTVASSRAVYITTDDGDILAACSPDQQPHPRSFLTDFDLSLIQVGQRVWIESDDICFSNGAKLNLSESNVWNRQPKTRPNAASPQLLYIKYDSLLRTATALHEGENFGLALPSFFSQELSWSQLPPDATSPLVATGILKIKELLPLCRYGNLQSVLELTRELIGLGHGLTPSGDDFVGGFLFMIHHLSNTYPTHKWWNKTDTSEFMNYFQLMTSQISYALLTDLATGQSHESLHDLADDLLSRRLKFDAKKHIQTVTQIGHSSGWDILTGMLTGLLPVAYEAAELKP